MAGPLFLTFMSLLEKHFYPFNETGGVPGKEFTKFEGGKKRNGAEYRIGKHKVEIYYNEIIPAGSSDHKRGAVYLPGFASTENIPKEMNIAGEIARQTGCNTLAISTNMNTLADNPLEIQAEAIRRFLVEKRQFEEFLLVGHSEGGYKVGCLAALFEKMNPEKKLRGVVFICPVGLYQYPGLDLAARTMIESTASIIKNVFELDKILGTGNVGDINGAIDIFWWMRLGKRVNEMSSPNEMFAKIKAPVVLLQGRDDLISVDRRTADERKIEALIKEKGITRLKARGEIMSGKGKVFESSEGVYWLKISKKGDHTAPFLRTKQVVASFLHLLKRHWREKEQAYDQT